MDRGDQTMAGRPYKCPYCGSTETTWKGYRVRKEGKVRLRRCRKCKRKFTTRCLVGNEPAREAGGESPCPP